VNTPNRIVESDWAGWVQERGAYFPSSWDQNAYKTVFAMNDPDEAPLKSSVLIAKHGKGYYVYTGLGFFRQLPAGVPGAYRLFADCFASTRSITSCWSARSSASRSSGSCARAGSATCATISRAGGTRRGS